MKLFAVIAICSVLALAGCIQEDGPREKAQACTLEYAPVCGEDGITYGNKCMAGVQGAKIAHEGECKAAAGEAGQAKEEPASEGEIIGMPNPASVNCKRLGGSLQIRSEEGGETGYCTLPDGAVCEEWALFRGECPKENKSAESEGQPESQKTKPAQGAAPSIPPMTKELCEGANGAWNGYSKACNCGPRADIGPFKCPQGYKCNAGYASMDPDNYGTCEPIG